ncbi:MAG: AAC(3) family N-acetyltransferase [Clostridiales bacterium]|nr:AAC(3) family N-acetyltransferase [Clostridiales bacterium]
MSSVQMQDLIDGFAELGLRKVMSVEVHSSLKSFGHVDGGANAVIDALIDSVGSGGNIVMSAFPMSKPLPLTDEDLENGLTTKIKILSIDDDIPSGMGVIADTFMKRPDVITGNGLFRVSAWGKDAERNSQKGFSYLIEKDQWALLLGVDIYSLTSMHYVEEYLPEEISAIFKPSKRILDIYDPNEWYVETGTPKVKAWYKIQDKAYENESIKQCMIGTSKCMFFKIQDVVYLYRDALKEYPYKLYEVDKP